jgi:hypothetical protein
VPEEAANASIEDTTLFMHIDPLVEGMEEVVDCV